MNRKVLKVGIAGYGIVGQRRRHYIDKHPGMETVAVCDIKYKGSGVLEDGVAHHAQYHQLLEEDLDALFVCMPNDVSPSVTTTAISKGLHVFCEKPPGRDLKDIIEIVRVERQNPEIKLKYGFNHRYHDSVREALRICHSNELGNIINLRGVYGKSKIVSFDSTWRTERAIAGGGILLDQGIHMLDLMRLFAGAEFTEVKSFLDNSVWKHDVEDNAYIIMRNSNNVYAMLHSTATQWRHRFRLEIALTKGMLILQGILSGSRSYGSETLKVARVLPSDRGNGEPQETTTTYVEDNSWLEEIEDFYKSIERNLKVEEGSSLEALRTMKLVYDIYCADQNWKKTYNIGNDLPADIRTLLES